MEHKLLNAYRGDKFKKGLWEVNISVTKEGELSVFDWNILYLCLVQAKWSLNWCRFLPPSSRGLGGALPSPSDQLGRSRPGQPAYRPHLLQPPRPPRRRELPTAGARPPDRRAGRQRGLSHYVMKETSSGECFPEGFLLLWQASRVAVRDCYLPGTNRSCDLPAAKKSCDIEIYT